MSDTKSKHTPGPWSYYETGAFPETNHFFGIGSNCGTGHVAKVEGFGDQAEANARLIASAPELLEAAQAAWNCIAELPPTQARVEVAQALQGAIAKATGSES